MFGLDIAVIPAWELGNAVSGEHFASTQYLYVRLKCYEVPSRLQDPRFFCGRALSGLCCLDKAVTLIYTKGHPLQLLGSFRVTRISEPHEAFGGCPAPAKRGPPPQSIWKVLFKYERSGAFEKRQDSELLSRGTLQRVKSYVSIHSNRARHCPSMLLIYREIISAPT